MRLAGTCGERDRPQSSPQFGTQALLSGHQATVKARLASETDPGWISRSLLGCQSGCCGQGVPIGKLKAVHQQRGFQVNLISTMCRTISFL